MAPSERFHSIGAKGSFRWKTTVYVVRRVDMVDRSVGACLSAANFTAEERIESPLDVARGQQLPVVEVDSLMQMKDVRLRIGHFPTVSEPRLQVEVVVSVDQRIEEKRVDSLRLRINSYAGIQIRRTELDHHHQRVRIGLARTAGE